MTSPDVITEPTNNALRDAVAKYVSAVAVPSTIEGATAFAKEYYGPGRQIWGTWAEAGRQTSPAEGLLGLVLCTGPTTSNCERVDISLEPPEGGPVAIVKPGWYTQDDEIATQLEIEQGQAQYARPILRRLTEPEGIGLMTDLQTIIERTDPKLRVPASA